MKRSGMRERCPRISLRSIRATRPAVSVQARRLEEAVAVCRHDLLLERLAVAIDGERDLGAGGAARPDAPIEPGKVAHLETGDREHHVAGVEAGLLRRAALGEADDDDAIL